MENSVFIRRYENFTSKTMISRLKILEMPIYRWRRWFLSGKTEILTRKRGFLCRKQQFTSKIVLYSGKLSFYQKETKILRRNRCFLEKKNLGMPFYSGEDGFYQEKQKF